MKSCSFPECRRPHKAKGWCAYHHQRWLRHGDPAPKSAPACDMPGCDIPIFGSPKWGRGGRGWCGRHMNLFNKFGDPLGSPNLRGTKASPETRAKYAAASALVRADLRSAKTMRELGRRRDVEFYLARAETHGRPLTNLEREFAEGVRMEANRERDQAVLAADVKELTAKGMSAREIGEVIGVTERTVIRIRGVVGITQSTWNNRKEQQ